MEGMYIEVGNRIQNLRKKQNLTREKLAELSDISVQFLADIEKGRKNMTVTTLRKLSSALFVTSDYIINGDVDLYSDDNEFVELYKTLSPKQKKCALEMLRLLVKIVEE